MRIVFSLMGLKMNIQPPFAFQLYCSIKSKAWIAPSASAAFSRGGKLRLLRQLGTATVCGKQLYLEVNGSPSFSRETVALGRKTMSSEQIPQAVLEQHLCSEKENKRGTKKKPFLGKRNEP